MNSHQIGTVGDLTASRKVRVFDVPLEEAWLMSKRGEKPPEHMASCVYLEWFSESNGRVVIESTDFEVTVSAPEWRMAPEEEEERKRLAAQGMAGFLEKAEAAIRGIQKEKPLEEPWDEYDYEQFLKQCDARTERLMELTDKYGMSEEAWEKIEQEMGWNSEDVESDSGAITPDDDGLEEILDAPEPEPPAHREGLDWVRTEHGRIAHPLQHRCYESALRCYHEIKGFGLDELADNDLQQFRFEFQTTAVKLAGALGPIARGNWSPEPAFTVAYLKRALDHLHQSLSGLEALAQRKVLPEEFVIRNRKEQFEIREGILRLMDKLRGR